MLNTIWTIGHSNITLEEFTEKLNAHNIELLVDVRSHPGSRTVPWTNKANLMSVFKDRYLWMPELGGPTDGDYSDPLNFPKHRIGKTRPEFAKIKKEDRPNKWWNQGLADFDRWMGTDPKFKVGLERLNSLTKNKRVAICCGEILAFKCHRSLIADTWCALGGEVFHIMTIKSLVNHREKYNLPSRLSRYEYAQVLWGNVRANKIVQLSSVITVPTEDLKL